MKLPIKPLSTSLISSGILGVAVITIIAVAGVSNHHSTTLNTKTTADETSQTNPDASYAPQPTTNVDTPTDTQNTPPDPQTAPTGTVLDRIDGTTPTSADVAPTAPQTPAPPTVVDTTQTKSDDGTTTSVTCVYTWSDGSQTSKLAGAYPDYQPSDGYNSYSGSFGCPTP